MGFKQSDYTFSWADIGDIEKGRPNLGQETHLAVYRLMQYSMRTVLSNHNDENYAAETLREAGWLAGTLFCQNMLNKELEPAEFIAEAQSVLKDLKIGILRMEKMDLENFNFTVSVAEDLDCSGLPLRGYPVCEYDEGFLAGIFEVYLGKPFIAREVDCWATGDRTCRFEIILFETQ